ncbi:MAG: IS1 family transposase [Chloroflexota bacterium]
MDPHRVFCPNPDCRDKGQHGQGNIRIHSHKERRYRCTTCGKTFAATAGTACYRLHHPVEVLVLVVTLLCHGCPVQAIVAAFGLDERTVTAWLHRAGEHSARVHEAVVQTGQVEVGQVQADEICVKVWRGRVWQAMALAVPSRLWLGGEVSATRDGTLLTALLRRVAAAALSTALLICVDGFSAYVGAVRTVFRVAVRTGRRGRPRLVLPETVLLAQVVKSHQGRRLVDVTRRVVFGTAEAVAAAIARTKGGTQINTAYIERLNATFRACLVPLTRRGRRLAHGTALLHSGMWLVGTAYNFCWVHESLRLRAIGGRSKWLERTPAMAAGLTDHIWTMEEVLRYRVPPAAGAPPSQRSRPPTVISLARRRRAKARAQEAVA